MSVFDNYKKKKDFIVCIDSDGCAMDTMNIKHIRCFGPCMVEEWNLQEWKDEILNRWNEINLYTETRGINRFKGLAMMLCEVNEKYTEIEGIDVFEKWAEDARELSNSAVENMIQVNPIFLKALNWSKNVNASIEKLPQEKIKPFEGVAEAFRTIHENCDIAVVSSANPEAVRKEWERFGLLEMVDIVCTQEAGTKAYCISEIAKKGYDKDHILMCGDAPGDENAAGVNSVLFYPILVKHETESWRDLNDTVLTQFLSGQYIGENQRKMIDRFHENLR